MKLIKLVSSYSKNIIMVGKMLKSNKFSHKTFYLGYPLHQKPDFEKN